MTPTVTLIKDEVVSPATMTDEYTTLWDASVDGDLPQGTSLIICLLGHEVEDPAIGSSDLGVFTITDTQSNSYAHNGIINSGGNAQFHHMFSARLSTAITGSDTIIFHHPHFSGGDPGPWIFFNTRVRFLQTTGVYTRYSPTRPNPRVAIAGFGNYGTSHQALSDSSTPCVDFDTTGFEFPSDGLVVGHRYVAIATLTDQWFSFYTDNTIGDGTEFFFDNKPHTEFSADEFTEDTVLTWTPLVATLDDGLDVVDYSFVRSLVNEYWRSVSASNLKWLAFTYDGDPSYGYGGTFCHHAVHRENVAASAAVVYFDIESPTAIDFDRDSLLNRNHTLTLSDAQELFFNVLSTDEDDTIQNSYQISQPGEVVITATLQEEQGSSTYYALYVTEDSEVIIAQSPDWGRTWPALMADTVATGIDLATFAWGGPLLLILTYAEADEDWSVIVAIPESDGTLTLSSPAQRLNLDPPAAAVLGRLSQRQSDGVWEFLYETTGNESRFVRCQDLQLDGTGTWA